MKQETILLEDNISFTGYKNEYVFEKIKSGTFYENELLEKWTEGIDENSIVFDIGANLGNHTVYFSKIRNAKAVYSFEPVRKNYELLEKNCANNQCDQVKLFNIGIGACNSFATASDNQSNFGALELTEDSEGDIKVFAIDELDLPAPDYIKIDVEGFEVKVLQGMAALLERYSPDIWIEVRPETAKDVYTFLKEKGYILQDFNNFNLLFVNNAGNNVNQTVFEKILVENMNNLNAHWKYKESSMKYCSAYQYEQKKFETANEQLQIKDVQLIQQQEKINNLTEEIAKKERALVEELAISEKYRRSSMRYCSAYLYEQKKCESLKKEFETYKSSKLYKLQHKIWKVKSDTRFYAKKYIYKLVYKVYRIIEPYPTLVRFAYKVNDKLQIVKDKNEARQIYQSSQNVAFWKNGKQEKKRIKELKVAAILDEFSYNCFKYECKLLTIEPDNWLDIFEKEKPELFFCESAWSGVDSERRPWKGQVYSSINFSKENRKVLLSILEYCKDHDIPTIFWNKEDPSHYEDKVHNFVDTAIKFDHIFTTAEECVNRYKEEYGHKSVHSLMFATQPKMFNPIEQYERTDDVIFAGSWYAYHEQRCKEMEEIFDKILASGKNLVIYDRYYGDSDPNHIFPKKYEPYIKPALPFEEIDKAYKGSKLALNITTVTESETMFARRVFELASCNTAIISNYSVGIEKVFGNNILFTNKELDFTNLEKMKAANLDNVLTYHTYAQRMEQILDDIGYEYLPEDKSVSIYYLLTSKEEIKSVLKHFQSITYIDKHLKIIYDDSNMDIYMLRELELLGLEFYCKSYLEKYNNDIKDTSAYIAYANTKMSKNFVEKAILHFCYLKEGEYISQSSNGIKISTINKEKDVNSLYKNSWRRQG